jgi:hypothetical protein
MLVRSPKSNLESGERVEVEVGARWVVKAGRQERVPGIWVACEVLRDSERELVVKLTAG